MIINVQGDYLLRKIKTPNISPPNSIVLLDIYSLDVYNQDEILDELDIWEVVEN
jgi:hypothetical protein